MKEEGPGAIASSPAQQIQFLFFFVQSLKKLVMRGGGKKCGCVSEHEHKVEPQRVRPRGPRTVFQKGKAERWVHAQGGRKCAIFYSRRSFFLMR